MKTLGIGLEGIRSDRIRSLYKTTRALVAPLGPGLGETAYKQRANEAEGTLATLDAVRRSSPEKTTKSLVDAHDALVAAVNDPERKFASMTMAIDAFTEQAKELRDGLSTRVKH